MGRGTAKVSDLRDSDRSIGTWAQFDLTELSAVYGAGGEGAPFLAGKIGYSATWRSELASFLKCAIHDPRGYRAMAVCENTTGMATYPWGEEEGSLAEEPKPEDFPLSVWCFLKADSRHGPEQPGPWAEPSPGPAGTRRKSSATGGTANSGHSGAGTSGTKDPGIDLARVLKDSLEKSSAVFSEALRDVAGSMGRGGGGGGGGGQNGERMNSTIKVELPTGREP